MKINKIEKLDKKYTSFDIETETHNFYANDLLVHNSNASVVLAKKEFWVQSRKNIINIEKDNAGFAFFVSTREETLKNIINQLAEIHDINLTTHGIALFGEFAGGNIQKNSCLSGCDKKFIIFKYAKVFKIEDTEESSVWIDTKGLEDKESDIFNVVHFGVETLEIDFDRPDIAQEKMIEMVEDIENNSKIAKYFGKPENIGEGYVGFFEYKGDILRFKIKGTKHSANTGRVKTLKPVDVEKENIKREFVNNIACISWRLEQAWNETFKETEPDIKKTGDYLRWIIKDVMGEEKETMKELGFEPKEVNGLISKVARSYFMDRLNSFS